MDFTYVSESHGGYVSVESRQHLDLPHSQASRTPSPASSEGDTFSQSSDGSSQTSASDNEEDYSRGNETSCRAKLAESGVEDHFAKPNAPTTLTDGYVQHQHPRRSSSSAAAKRPPPLSRQDERKVLFVNDLVDSATSLVSVIWPLSNTPSVQGSNSRGVLPLRRYIEETLRRSRTSYSTLQVALYYLILIKSHIPRHDFTKEQSADCASLRAMQCGRRMFLASLILASKYLQDRNYSAKAWSKMSGLKTTEINSNERMFLSAVGWKLHIPDTIFKRWSEIVLRFTAPPNPPSPSAGIAATGSNALWARVTPLLTPELDDPRILSLSNDPRTIIPGKPGFSLPSPASTAGTFTLPSLQLMSLDGEVASPSMTPRCLEPRSDTLPPTPGLARLGPLPTPQMTPTSNHSSTPAASACNSRRPSISLAMAQANNNAINRITCDRAVGSVISQRSSSVRHPSVAPSFASCSSPESMVSDLTRSSRSSSISSVSTTSIGAPYRALARPATYRSVPELNVINLNMTPIKMNGKGTAEQPITIVDEIDLTASPTPYMSKPRDQDDGTVASSHPTIPIKSSESRKRCRSRPSSIVDSDLQQQVRHLVMQQAGIADNSSLDRQIIRDASPFALQSAAIEHAHPRVTKQAVRCSAPALFSRSCSASRLPIGSEDGRKKICLSVTPNGLPELFMKSSDDVWEVLS